MGERSIERTRETEHAKPTLPRQQVLEIIWEFVPDALANDRVTAAFEMIFRDDDHPGPLEFDKSRVRVHE